MAFDGFSPSIELPKPLPELTAEELAYEEGERQALAAMQAERREDAQAEQKRVEQVPEAVRAEEAAITDPRVQKIEEVLNVDLEELYKGQEKPLEPKVKEAFLKERIEIAQAVAAKGPKLNVVALYKRLRAWSRQLTRLNKYYLDQQAHIMAVKIRDEQEAAE